MTDVTNDWAGGEKPRQAGGDPTMPAPGGDRLIPDSGEHTAPAAVSPAPERKSFGDRARSGSTGDGSVTVGEEPLLKTTLETIRVKAEELRAQTKDWTRLRQDQARDLIDERPITAVASAFGVGVVIGALLKR